MKKIAIFSNDLSVGGIQKSLYNFLRNIDLTKYSIDLYLMKDNNFYQDKIPKEIKVFYMKNHSKIRQLLFYDINKLFYKYEGKNIHYDIAIDYDGYQQQTAFNTLNANADKKVMWVHSDWIEKPKYERKFKYNLLFSKGKNMYFDEYVGVSKGAIDAFKKVIKKDDIKYMIIPNIIDTKEIFEKSNEKCDLKVDKNKYNFVTLGRLNIQKGFDILVNYINELKEYRKDFHLYIIGDGEEKENLINQVNSLALNDYITLLGSQKNPYKYLKLMDGFVLTSRYEGQGMVLWEGKALGLELFMTKNLEKYNKGLKGYSDIISAMKKAKKKNKKNDDLKDYNEDIINSLDKLLGKETVDK